LFFGETGFQGDSDQSGPEEPGSLGGRGYAMLPDTGSGAPLLSNGNKGVYFPSIQCHNIYTLFFGQIFYPADPGFSSSISGAIATTNFIKSAPIGIPGPARAPREPEGQPFHPFFIPLYISSLSGKPL
jgi:hypothetical protein